MYFACYNLNHDLALSARWLPRHPAAPGRTSQRPGAATQLERISDVDAQILNFKPYSSGAMVGFFDLEAHGLVITGCRGFRKGDALWFGWPSEKVPGDNLEVAYKDIIVCADPVMKHLRGLVPSQLRQLLEATPAATRPLASSRRGSLANRAIEHRRART